MAIVKTLANQAVGWTASDSARRALSHCSYPRTPWPVFDSTPQTAKITLGPGHPFTLEALCIRKSQCGNFAWLPYACIAALADCHDVMLIDCTVKYASVGAKNTIGLHLKFSGWKACKVKNSLCARFWEALRVQIHISFSILDHFEIAWRSAACRETNFKVAKIRKPRSLLCLFVFSKL